MGGRLKDRVALVFGAGSSGPGWSNGKAAAVSYAREGAPVACVDIDRAAAERDPRRKSPPRAAAPSPSPATRPPARPSPMRSPGRWPEWGRIDVLHNNVGHAALGGPVELGEAEWRREIDLNLNCVFLACKHVLPIMAAQGTGAVVNISSIAALRYTGYDYASYYAAKGAGEPADGGASAAIRPRRDSRQRRLPRADGHADGPPAARRRARERRGDAARTPRRYAHRADGHGLGRRQRGGVPGQATRQPTSPPSACRWMAGFPPGCAERGFGPPRRDPGLSPAPRGGVFRRTPARRGPPGRNAMRAFGLFAALLLAGCSAPPPAAYPPIDFGGRRAESASRRRRWRSSTCTARPSPRRMRSTSRRRSRASSSSAGRSGGWSPPAGTRRCG